MNLVRPLQINDNQAVLVTLESGKKEWVSLFELNDLETEDQKLLLKKIASVFSFMPEETGSDVHQLNDIYKRPIKNSVTFFGGSFNPFHLGHLECVKLCPEENIVIVPDHNPHKDLRELENPFNEFLNLLEKFKQTNASIYPGFLTLNRSNPTADWLVKVQVLEINFLMGDDSFMNLLRWKTPEILLNRLTKLYVVPRNFNESDYREQVKKIKDLNPHLIIEILSDHPYKNLSSTSLRK